MKHSLFRIGTPAGVTTIGAAPSTRPAFAVPRLISHRTQAHDRDDAIAAFGDPHNTL